ncbi:tRNA(Ile)-lysidine synthetase [hydrothermal vent metagenome]|uniref:tRNA(Ile)-lysidine synthetase n=1 Tax=hydrothermal vent metagenome TaxID=652676 RepID=A0A3B1ABZ3_9ZZZZ
MLTVESFWRDLSKLHSSYTPADTHYLLAYSGGLDSHVLLHLLVELKKLNHINHLSVVHINHQLHADSSQWAAHCLQQCEQYQLSCDVINVIVDKNSGLGLEAAARQARYSAFKTLVTDQTLLLTAQHADDQVETFLLQSLRGGGVKGLAAMPVIKSFANGYLSRPLLAVTQQAIVDYAKQHNLSWVDDPSNSNINFDRNYLRQQVVPVLKKRWPSIHKTFSRVTQHQAENKKLLVELAQMDLQQLDAVNNTLSISRLQTLSLHRKKNVLRYWLHNINELSMPDAMHLNRVLNEVMEAAVDSQPCVTWGDAIVRRYNDKLYADKLAAEQLSQTENLIWTPEEQYSFGSKQLVTEKCEGQGLSVSQLQSKNVTIRFRQGGETCCPQGRGPHQHKLKKLFQEWQVLPWQRNAVPLIYVDNILAQVVGYCLCEPFVAKPNELGYLIQCKGIE